MFTRNAKKSMQTKAYHLYVVELEGSAAGSPGPMGCVYVGETGQTPEERFAKHLAGGRTASLVVRRYGKKLRPDLVPGDGRFSTRDEAVDAESQLAEELRIAGFTVFGGQGASFHI